MRSLLVTLALLCAIPTRAADPFTPRDRQAAPARRLALVVGTSDYLHADDWPRLPNAVSDADALAAELGRRYGYEVTRVANPDTASFKRALVALSAAAGERDDVLVFVAGHGWFDAEDKAGYLVFGDGEASCARGCYPLDNVKRALFDSRARHVLVMLDACYAGTFDIRVALGGAADRGPGSSDPASFRRVLDEYAQYPSRLVLASIGKEPTSDGARGSHSPFMARVLGALARPGPARVVSLDHLWSVLQADSSAGPSRVGRPTPFEAARPHHPNGTFLFIEDIGFCEAVHALSAAATDGFAAVRVGAARTSYWGTAWSAAWTLPGASACDVWSWETDGRVELRCELGSMSPAIVERHAPLVLADLRACLDDGWSETTGPTHGALPDVRRAHASNPERSAAERGLRSDASRQASGRSNERAVTLTTTCTDDCTMSLIFE